MTVQSKVSATYETAESAVIGPQTVLALPPSSDDPAPDRMRVVVNNIVTTRGYDPST